MKVQILMNIKFSLYTVGQYRSTKGKLWGLNKDFQPGLRTDLHTTENSVTEILGFTQ